jgi:hypothetical protein
MGYSYDLPDELFMPGMKENLKIYLMDLPIPGMIKKQILLEYGERTNELISASDIERVYPEENL